VVELSNTDEVEYLTVSVVPRDIAPEDVLYPDLLDDLRLARDMGDGVPMPAGLEYEIKTPAHAWGTPHTVAKLREGIITYARGTTDEPPVHVGDLSRKGGGVFPPHLSHREGRDVDIGYVLRGAVAHEIRFVNATAGNLDRARSWELLSALLDTGAVAYVFMDYDVQRMLYEHARAAGVSDEDLAATFQYPRGRRASRGVVRHWKGHKNHFHVRFFE
jgi:murein endopeptidase